MRKASNILIYILLLGAGVYLLSKDAWSSLFTDTGTRTGILLRIAIYFKDADSWAIIFMMITFGVGMSAFLLLSVMVEYCIRRSAARCPSLRFTMTPWGEKVFQIPFAFALLLVVFILTANGYITIVGRQYSATKPTLKNRLPVFVLGTSKYLRSGKENVYYRYRIETAVDLYTSGKASYFILSGDGVGEQHIQSYDETKDMQEDLIAAGIPAESIKLDRFGFNTHNSILRLRGIFHLKEVLIVSQDFHSPRAVVLGRYYGINARAYNARGSATHAMLWKEIFQSRPKLVMDILFANMQPRVKSHGDFLYREKFEATRSNTHVLIVLTMIIVAFVAPMGFGIFLAKEGLARRRAAVRYSIITFGFSIVLTTLTLQVYKTTDIRFITELVDAVSETFGLKISKVQTTRPRAIKRKQNIPVSNDELLTKAPTQTAAAKIESSLVRSIQENQIPDIEHHHPMDSSLFEAPTFNTAEGEEKESASTAVSNTNVFQALVHDSQNIINDGTIRLRLASPLKIADTQFEKNFVFECHTILFNGRVIIKASEIGSHPIDAHNYEGQLEGMLLQSKHRGKKGETFLSEGEIINFSY